MGTVRVGFVRRAETDHGIDDDQGRFVGGRAELTKGGLQTPEFVGVGHMDRVPAKPAKALRDAFAKRQVRMAFDRDPVVIIDPAEVGKLQMPRDRCRFGCDTFHQIPIAAQCIHIVVEQFITRLVVLCAQML